MDFWLWWGGTGIVFAVASCRIFSGPMSVLDILVCITLGLIAGPVVWVIQGFGWYTNVFRPQWLPPGWLTERRFTFWIND